MTRRDAGRGGARGAKAPPAFCPGGLGGARIALLDFLERAVLVPQPPARKGSFSPQPPALRGSFSPQPLPERALLAPSPLS